MPFTLIAPRRGSSYRLPAIVQPCRRDFDGVDMQAVALLVDTGATSTVFQQATFPGLRVARHGQMELADGRLIASGFARVHVVFPSAPDVPQNIATVQAVINIDGLPSADGLLGMDLIRELTVKAEYAGVTVGARGHADVVALEELLEELRCDCLKTLRAGLQRVGLK